MADADLLVNRAEPKTNFFLFPPLESAAHRSAEDSARALGLHNVGDDRDYVAFLAVPYCRVRCQSCHCFKHVLPQRADEAATIERYVDALCAQIAGYGETNRLAQKGCGAIYFGGGTASLLRPKDMARLLEALRSSLSLREGLEITLEGSPLEFDEGYLAEMQGLGVTRLSIGFQSRFDVLLEVLNSPHRSQAGLRAIQNALRAGFDCVNVDLLYNIPRQTREMWERDVDALIADGVDSISMGDYMIFPQSPAEKLIQQGKNPPQHPQEEVYGWFEWAVDRLAAAGYWENVRGIFPKRGMSHAYVELSCIANSDIVGIGTGAYSFVSGYQLRNTLDVEHYVSQMLAGRFLSFDSMSRPASPRDLKIRFVIHNLFASRVKEDDFRGRFGAALLDEFAPQIARLRDEGWVETNAEGINLTREGRKQRKYVYHEFYCAA